uniref:Uncharacterized protein n=1 Tax=viral metagenome TaxID=1070528 RepID=A0A6C0AUY9_9ZZZZ
MAHEARTARDMMYHARNFQDADNYLHGAEPLHAELLRAYDARRRGVSLGNVVTFVLAQRDQGRVAPRMEQHLLRIAFRTRDYDAAKALLTSPAARDLDVAGVVTAHFTAVPRARSATNAFISSAAVRNDVAVLLVVLRAAADAGADDLVRHVITSTCATGSRDAVHAVTTAAPPRFTRREGLQDCMRAARTNRARDSIAQQLQWTLRRRIALHRRERRMQDRPGEFARGALDRGAAPPRRQRRRMWESDEPGAAATRGDDGRDTK